MNKQQAVDRILEQKKNNPTKKSGKAFAPSNIALCKYWGKRDTELNLPNNSSLSISLGDKGTTTDIKINASQDTIILNGKLIDNKTAFAKRTIEFLSLFRPTPTTFFDFNTVSNIPIAAGLASSASGFASAVLALDDLFQWQLSKQELSILARLGSGSASRSLWQGFVQWHAGAQADGMDSFAEPIKIDWPELSIGLLIFESSQKPISSREAMKNTVNTSKLYQQWPKRAEKDCHTLQQAILNKDFKLLGETAEQNALAMHDTMLDTSPPIDYSTEQTLAAREKIWDLRKQGVDVYFTQDAGPNLKLLFLQDSESEIKQHFPRLL